VVVVATPDLASLRNAKNMIDLIKQGRPNDAPPRLVLNQVGVPGRPEIPAKDFGAALGVHPSLIIPFDAKTVRRRRQQRPDDHRRGRQVQGRRGLPDPGPDRLAPRTAAAAGPKGKAAPAAASAKSESKSLFGLFKKKS
jgi:pilus assembly protein CpaE